MRFEKTQVFNFEGAFRGLRNPLNSWAKSDSYFDSEKNILGPADLGLAQRMIKAGDPSHRKFMRQIFVSVDITAPLFYWKELDTYKIGTTANSTSTMHKLAATPITLDCFERDDADPQVEGVFWSNILIPHLENLRKNYNETKDPKWWKELVRLLPNAWLQTRTWTANYEVLRNMYWQRKNHKLKEWHTFCEWVESLPYAQELILYK